jgi:hypothetical protein
MKARWEIGYSDVNEQADWVEKEDTRKTPGSFRPGPDRRENPGLNEPIGAVACLAL